MSGSGGPAEDVTATTPTIAGYELREEIHRGGQGVVYRAVQLGTKREVALKVLLEGPFASESARRRFEREIELAAGLRHPNIVTILDSGLSLGRYYFAMEYIAGERLDRYLARQRPPLRDCLLLFEKICRAVNFAHQRGVIHRDLKPPNILVDAEGEPHILDFGLAKHISARAEGESTVQMLSTSGQILGTVAYMSPEQALGSPDVDVRSDVYSLGVIFYEALSGQPPYSVTGPLGEVLNRIAHEDAVSPRSITARLHGAPKISDELATILLKALEKEPQRRYQTAGDLARDLRRLLDGEPIEAKRASGLYMLKKTLRRYRLQAASAGLILLMLVGFLVTFAVLFKSERDARQREREQAQELERAKGRTEAALAEAEQQRAAAQEQRAEALAAQRELERALVRQHIQRGDLALARSELGEARDSYWSAYLLDPGPAATWALRRYYLQTAEFESERLALQLHGPARLDGRGRYAAACTSPLGIAVRDLEQAATIAWLTVPGPVAGLAVGDDGSIAATGAGWVRAWAPGATAPRVVARLPDEFAPHALFALPGGEEAVVVGQRQVLLLTDQGRPPVGVSLRGVASGRADFAPRLRQVAVPTSVGVERVSLDDGTAEVVWAAESAPARAVRFEGDELLAVLADAVYVAPVAELRRHAWTRFVELDGSWDLFDLRHGIGAIVTATRSGQFAYYESGTLRGSAQLTQERIEELCLVSGDRSVVTLDARGTVSRWIETERVARRRAIYAGEVADWATSADGSTVLLGAPDGRVLVYRPAEAALPRTLLRPRLLGGAGGDLALALSGDGSRAVIRERRVLRFVDVARGEARPLVWRHPRLSEPSAVSLSGDGTLAALLTRSGPGDVQRVVLLPWRTAEMPVDPPAGRNFVGALVRDIVFAPLSTRLLVVRSNGALFFYDAHELRDAESRGLPGGAGTPWLELESPATRVAFNRSGEYLAAACEDNALRIVLVPRAAVLHRVPLPLPVRALAFHPQDDVLLARLADGTVRLIDPATGESLATWAQPARTDRPLAAWIVADDGLLLGDETGVYEQRYRDADALIEHNRMHARSREVLRLVADGRFAAAWDAAEAAGLGPDMLESIAELALRRRVRLPAGWTGRLLDDTTPRRTWLRLGHAAYDGEQFDLARSWLERARELGGDPLDAVTLQRIAECAYLADDYVTAAAGLAAAHAAPDFEPARLPTVLLEQVAALMLADRPAEARQVALRLGETETLSRSGDLIATTAARIISRFLTGLESESLMSAGLDGLLASFADRSLDYRDDVHFFAGELLRHRGRSEEAAVLYQRCIDVSRDVWPAGWSRHRLAQLAAGGGPQEAP